MVPSLTSQESWVLNKNENQCPPFQLCAVLTRGFQYKAAILTVKAAAAAKVAENWQYNHKGSNGLFPCVFSWAYILLLR